VRERRGRAARLGRNRRPVPSITIGADGLGLISYYDVTNADLKVAHLSNVRGLPYVRSR